MHFIDIEKAFDSVNRECLWNILLVYGCPEKLVNIIQLFYINLLCSVIHNSNTTEWF